MQTCVLWPPWVQSVHDAPLVPQDVSAPVMSQVPVPSQQPEHVDAQSLRPPELLPLVEPLPPLELPLPLPLAPSLPDPDEDDGEMPPPSVGLSPGPPVAQATKRTIPIKAKPPAAK
jgi:hypothetical protein